MWFHVYVCISSQAPGVKPRGGHAPPRPRGGTPVGRFSGCSNVRAPPGQRSLTLPGDAALPGRPRSPRPPCAGRLPRGTIPPTNTASRFGTPPTVPHLRGGSTGMGSPASCTSESWVGRKASQRLTPRCAAACNAAKSLLTRLALLPATPNGGVGRIAGHPTTEKRALQLLAAYTGLKPVRNAPVAGSSGRLNDALPPSR